MKNSWIRILSALAVLEAAACGLPPLPAGTQGRPHVVAAFPENGSSVTEWPVVEIEFSEPVLKESVTPYSLFVMNRADYDAYDEADWVNLYKDVKDGEAAVIDSSISFSNDGRHAFLAPAGPDVTAGEFAVVALPAILSPDYRPLDQTAAGEPVRQFQTSFFWESDAGGNGVASESSGKPPTSQNGSDVAKDGGVTGESSSGPEQSEEDDSTPGSFSPDGESEESGAGFDESAGTPVEVPAADPFDFNRLLITEVVTDPQQDHGESGLGNGIKFDGIPGTGSVGSTDEYVEIYNGTGESLNLAGWSLSMRDGTDVEESLGDTGWTKFFSAGGSLENFLSGEVLVLGNPNGDMKNAIALELTDEAGQSVQSVYADDANAESVFDESFRLNELGTWEMGPATPGEFEY